MPVALDYESVCNISLLTEQSRFSGKRVRRNSELYPYLEEEDLREALVYAAWRTMEIEPRLVNE